MVLLFDTNGNFVAKENERAWKFSQKKNNVGTGSIDGIPFYKGVKYATLYKGKEKIKDVVLKDTEGKRESVKYNVQTLEGLLKNYKLPASWHGWDDKPLSFVLSDALFRFDYIRKSRLEDFTNYLEKTNIDLNTIKDGAIHLSLYEQDDGLYYHEQGTITFAFDCGEVSGERFLRWSEIIGEKVYVGIQSVGSDTPITSIAQIDFSNVPIVSTSRGLENASATQGAPIVSNKRYVAVRFVLKYVNADFIKDFASLEVYNENNILVTRTVRGFTPVIKAFEIITRGKTEFNLKAVPTDLSELVKGLEFSSNTVWDALQIIRKKYPFDSRAYFENGKVYFEFAKSLEKENHCEVILRADDKAARHLNNTNVKSFKNDMQKVNVLHCYGEGEKQSQVYVRIPEVGTFDGGEVVEDNFTDTKIKTPDELREAGLVKLRELRKEEAEAFEIETPEKIRLFDVVPLVYPEDKEKPFAWVRVVEEKIEYTANVYKQSFGIGDFRFNPFQFLIKEKPLPEVRTFAYKPFSIIGYGKSTSISLQWSGAEDNYIVRWKKQSDTEYNYRAVAGRTSDFNGLENYQRYLFSVAGTFNGAVSEYTEEISAEPVDWATDPSNPDNAVNKAIAARTPKYLGVVETVPTTRTAVITKGERLGAQDANPGDWVLMAKTAGGWKVGVCYRWTGALWQPLVPEKNYPEYYHVCMIHICEIDELMKNTGHFGALFAKAIVAQEAFINKLAAEQAFLRKLVVQKLRIDSDPNSHQDFEAWFDKDNGLKIKNKGEEVFKVDTNGNIFIKGSSATLDRLIVPTFGKDPVDAVFGEIWFRKDM